REQLERRRRGRARERGVDARDGRDARSRQGDRIEQQGRRVARLRDPRAARDGGTAAHIEQAAQGPRREAGAFRRAHRRDDAERAGGDFVPDEPAGSEAAQEQRLPPAGRRVVVQRDQEISDVAQGRTDGGASIECRCRTQYMTTAIAAPSTNAISTIVPVRPSTPMRTSRSCVSPLVSFSGEMILTMTGAGGGC